MEYQARLNRFYAIAFVMVYISVVSLASAHHELSRRAERSSRPTLIAAR